MAVGEDEKDPFEGLVLDEEFVRGGSYEAPARTRDAIARHRGDPGWRGEPPTAPVAVPRRRRRRGLVALATIVVAASGAGIVVATHGHGSRASARTPAAASASPATTSTTRGPETELEGSDYQRGACYTWTQGQRRTGVRAVPCSEAHLYEHVSTTVLTAFAKDAAYPTDDQMTSNAATVCGAAVSGYLGYAPTDDDAWRASYLTPTAEGWGTGDRSVQCGVERSQLQTLDQLGSPFVVTTPFTGSAAKAARWVAPDPGTCTTPETVKGAQTTALVPCTTAHDTEHVGATSIDAASYPSYQRQVELGADRCRALAAAFAHRPLPETGATYVSQLEISAAAWAAGDRQVECIWYATPPRAGDLRAA